MKPHTGLRILIIGALIFALISGSAMAISKSELLASYTAQSGNISSKPMVSPAWVSPTPWIPSSDVVEPFPVWVVPTPLPSSGTSYFPSWFVPPSVKPTVSPTPAGTPSNSYEDTGGYIPCPPAVPLGELHQSFGMCVAYTNAAGDIIHGDCINPKTGYSYPIGIDALGNSYLVKPGCQCTWAD